MATGERAVWSHDKARVLGLPDDVAAGAAAVVHEDVAGARLRVSMASFFQASPQAAELLVDAVARAAGNALDGRDGVVVDAYGGVGLFAATVVPIRLGQGWRHHTARHGGSDGGVGVVRRSSCSSRRAPTC
ncbi:MAG: hypothetical protein EBX18_05880 [Actinobacteria bacterium]|nr:hypothetical protein [Actinomycetota bacterium]